MSLPPPVRELPDRLVSGARLLASRDAYLPLLPKNKVVAEIGVGLGQFSRKLLDGCAPARFIAIDTFVLHELGEFWGRPPAEYFGDRSHYDWYCAQFAEPIAAGRMQAMRGLSHDMLEQLDDASLDIVDVDADHTYEGVKRDLAVVARKVRPDGTIIMKDYILVDQLHATAPYGVIYATHEFMLEHDWAMQYFALQTSMFCDVVLRPAALVPSRDAEAALRWEVALLRDSTSWRVTAPLRALGRLLGRAP